MNLSYFLVFSCFFTVICPQDFWEPHFVQHIPFIHPPFFTNHHSNINFDLNRHNFQQNRLNPPFFGKRVFNDNFHRNRPHFLENPFHPIELGLPYADALNTPLMPVLPVPKIKPLRAYKRHFNQQFVDHFNKEEHRLWAQPYYLDLTHLDHKFGPVFLEIHGEFDIEHYYNIAKTPFMIMSNRIAQQFRAGVFALQHRYYAPDAIPTKNGSMAHHSSQHALADTAYFVQKVIRDKFKLRGPIFVAGCSYGGSLSVWFRRKYPHLAAGAIAKSPPLLAKAEVTEFSDHVEQVAKKMYPRCMRDIEHYIFIMRQMVKSNPREFLRKLDLCDTSRHSAENVLERVIITYTSSFMHFAQRGYNMTNIGGNLIGDKFCPLLRRGNIYGALKAVLRYSLESYSCPHYLSFPCLSLDVLFNGTKLLEVCKTKPELTQTDHNSKMWNWQKCTEFGWFQTVPDERSIFKFYTLQHHIELFCYNETVKDIEAMVSHTNALYGGLNLKGSSKILIIDGENDPWRVLSLPRTNNFNPHGVSSFVVEGGNHCPAADDIIGNILHQWIK